MATKNDEIKSDTLPALRVKVGLNKKLDEILLQEQQKQRNPALRKSMLIRRFIEESIERYIRQQQTEAA